jgi:hypothetical protein
MCKRCSVLRNELFLENGFGFDFSSPEVEVCFASSPEPGQDFQAFYEEQLGHMVTWLQQLPEWVEDDMLDSVSETAGASFISAIARAAEKIGATGFSQGEVLCGFLFEPMVLYALARQRLPAWSSNDEVLDTARRMTALGLSSAERAAEIRMRESLARRFAGKGGVVSESAQALRKRRFAHSRATPRPVFRPRSFARRRASGRRAGRHRRSPSRGSPARGSGDEPGAPGARGSAV